MSFSGSCFGVNDVWYQKKEVYTFNMEDSSLGLIDQHHAAAVLPDEHNPSKDQVKIEKDSIILLCKVCYVFADPYVLFTGAQNKTRVLSVWPNF